MIRFASSFAAFVLTAGLGMAQFDAQPKYDAAAVSALVDQVHADLDHAYGTYKFPKDDRERLNKSEKELREFSQKWNNGKFDTGELNGAIESIQKVFDKNKLPEDTRAAISNDLSQLRRMREAYEHHQIQK